MSAIQTPTFQTEETPSQDEVSNNRYSQDYESHFEFQDHQSSIKQTQEDSVLHGSLAYGALQNQLPQKKTTSDERLVDPKASVQYSNLQQNDMTAKLQQYQLFVKGYKLVMEKNKDLKGKIMVATDELGQMKDLGQQLREFCKMSANLKARMNDLEVVNNDLKIANNKLQRQASESEAGVKIFSSTIDSMNSDHQAEMDKVRSEFDKKWGAVKTRYESSKRRQSETLVQFNDQYAKMQELNQDNSMIQGISSSDSDSGEYRIKSPTMTSSDQDDQEA